MGRDARTERILTKRFVLTFLALFFFSMVMYLLMTTVAEYATTFGTGSMLAGMASGTYVVGGLVSRLGAGSLMSRLGWKRTALVFLALHTLACLGYFAASDIVSLVLVRFVHGLCFGAGASAIITIGMSVLPESRYSEAAGYFMMATTLSIAAGPYVGGIVYDVWHGPGCFAAATALSLLSFLFIAPVDIRDIDDRGASRREKAASPGVASTGINRVLDTRAMPVSICIFLFALGYVSVMSFYRMYGAQTGFSGVFSFFFLIYAAVLLLTRPIAGRIQDKVNDNRVVYPGIIAQAAGLFCMAQWTCPLTIVLCAIGCALGYGTLNSACNAIACCSAPTERRSYAVSTFWVFCDGGMGIGPTLMGAVAAASNYTVMYFAAAAVTALSLPVYYLVWGKGKGKGKGKGR